MYAAGSHHPASTIIFPTQPEADFPSDIQNKEERKERKRKARREQRRRRKERRRGERRTGPVGE